MYRISGLILLLIALCQGISAQSRVLSPMAQISLLTCAPGEELYSAFGHSGIRVYDPILDIDTVYNYGTFDFDPPGFYVKFARGKLNYRIDKEPYDYFQRLYRYLNRSFSEQVFNLDSTQRQAYYAYLEYTFRPENRYYLYDFFFDNCATRIPDGLLTVLGDSLELYAPEESSGMTFRECIDGYLGNLSWADYGIDLALGSVIDREMTNRQQTFHPDYLASYMDQAQIIRAGKPASFISRKQMVYESPNPQTPTPWFLKPVFLTGLLLAGLIFYTIRSWKRKQLRYPVDGLFFILVGLGGLVLFLLWFGTEHTTTKANFNLLWLMPVHLILAPLLFRSYPPRWLNIWFLISTVCSMMALVGWPLMPQSFSIAFLPLMLAVFLRSAALYLHLSRR